MRCPYLGDWIALALVALAAALAVAPLAALLWALFRR